MRYMILASVICAALCGRVISAEPVNSILLLVTLTSEGKRVGYACSIGDGTVAAAPYHLVFESSDMGRHEMAGTVVALSFYLGDSAFARLIAADRESDLVLLELPWRGHPGYQLATDAQLMALEEATILSPHEQDPLQISGLQRESLGVDSLIVRRRAPVQIRLAAPQKAGPGWSGSPILLPDEDTLLGLFTTLFQSRPEGDAVKLKEKEWNSDFQRLAIGPSSALIRVLAAQGGVTERLRSAKRVAQPTDAQTGAERWVAALKNRKVSSYEALLSLRPDSAAIHAGLASILADEGRSEAARAHFERALSLAPEDSAVRLLYGQFLSKISDPEALRILQLIPAGDSQKAMATLLEAQHLSERKEFPQALRVLSAGIAAFPQNASMRALRGMVYLQSGATSEAAVELKAAIQLWPEKESFRSVLKEIDSRVPAATRSTPD